MEIQFFFVCSEAVIREGTVRKWTKTQKMSSFISVCVFAQIKGFRFYCKIKLQMNESRKIASTKRKIWDAYIGLLEDKPFDKVTVREICDACEIVRSTFYSYYQSVFDLIENIENGMLADMHFYKKGQTELVRDNTPETEIKEELVAIGNKRFGIPLKSMEEYFKRLDERRDYLKAIIGKNGDPYFLVKLRKQIELDTDQMMNDEKLPDDFLRYYFLRASSVLVIQLTEYWVKTEDRISLGLIIQFANMIRSSASSIDLARVVREEEEVTLRQQNKTADL